MTDLNLIDEIDSFLTGIGTFPRSRWFENGEVQLYIRSRSTMLQQRCLALASISVQEECQGRRVGSDFIIDLENLAKKHTYEGLIVENVLNEKFGRHLSRLEYGRLDSTPPSYYILF